MNKLTTIARFSLFVVPTLLSGLLAGLPAMADEFRLGVRAKSGIEKAVRQWQPTIDYLNQELPAHNFSLVPVLSLEEMNRMAATKAFDFVLTNPSSYVEMQLQYDARALVTLNNKRANMAQARFGTVIFVHAARDDIRELKDLKGKTLMAVSRPAFGGWRVAWLELLENGIDPERDLKELRFAPGRTQQEVVYAVRDGKADVGVVRTDQLERMEAAGLIDLRYFRIINSKDILDFPFFLSTPLYPEWPIAAFAHVDAKLGEEVRKALLEMRADAPAAQAGNYIGWIEAADYAAVEGLMRRLRVGPFASGDR